jgi:hypothetical protein
VQPAAPAPTCPSSWLPLPSAPSFDELIGEVVAAAACAIAQALREFQNGGLRTETKMHGGDLIAQLYALRQYMVGYWDFDRVARTMGKQVLREGYGELKLALREPHDDLSEATLDELVSWPLDMLAKVVRSQLH